MVFGRSPPGVNMSLAAADDFCRCFLNFELESNSKTLPFVLVSVDQVFFPETSRFEHMSKWLKGSNIILYVNGHFM